MTTPQFEALPEGCSQVCKSFLSDVNQELARTAETMADFTGDDSEARRAALLSTVVNAELQSPRMKDVAEWLALERPSPLSLDETAKPLDPITAFNAMGDCAVRGCKLLRAAFITTL